MNNCGYTISNSINEYRKKTIDNSVTYIPRSEQTGEIKQDTIKNKSTPGKQNIEKFTILKMFLNNVAPQGFAILK